jgi:hypothetical protein
MKNQNSLRGNVGVFAANAANARNSADLVVVPHAGTALTQGIRTKFDDLRQHLGEGKKHATLAVWHAYAAGRILLDLKQEMIASGEEGFQDAIKRELPGFSYGTARNYMDFARKTGAANPEIKKLDEDKAAALLTQVADGKSLSQLYMDLGVVRRPANIDPETDKRLHHPAKITPEEKAETAATRHAGNWLAALDTLERETQQGGFAHLDDKSAETAYGRLRDLADELLSSVLEPRRRAKSSVPRAKKL